MAVDYEGLMSDLQRVSVQMRHNRCGHARKRMEGEQGNGLPEGHPPVSGKYPHPGHGHGHHHHHHGSGRHGQNRILAALTMQDGTSQKDLAYVLGIRPQSLTKALDTLCEEGYVERRQDEEDKRTNRVFLTESGRERAAQIAEHRRNYAENAFSMLTDEEKEQLAAILAKIAAALDEKEKAEGASAQEEDDE